jgi:hypothetical protein
MTTTKRNPQITVTLPPDLYQRVLEACEKEDLPIVYWARAAFRAKLKEDSNELDQDPCR